MKNLLSLNIWVPVVMAFFFTTPGSGQSTELNPTYDAYLENGVRKGGTLLRVEKGTRVRETYMLFDVSGVNGSITSMQLSLTVTSDAGAGPVALYLSNSANWNEGNLSNTNKPGLDISLGNITGSFSIGSVKTATIDPTLITGNTFSLIVVHAGADGDDMAFASRTGAAASMPKLVVNYSTGDTQAPTAPTVSSTGQSQTTVDISWTGANDNVGVTNYRVYQDGSVLTTLGNVTTYQVTGLTAATSYDFKVRALDAAGNQSPDSNTLNVTTDAGSGGTSVWAEANTTASYSGEVAVGRSTVPNGYKLAVEGNIRAREMRVDQDSWPDYVFKEGYDLPSPAEIKKHIQEKGHLPNIPSAAEVKANGLELGEMNRLLLEKIEELTLIIIDQEERIARLEGKKSQNN
ncbi:MAG: fibronectin type III domain-containing protein [Flavobacteriaceae bacterium]